ncbi:hypothetical protein [Paraliomyxa miuraensis]|uniref:hypothetical protein n=1 Tax=Paraliomyxa miuraensis TaxID=376150 RepID=UPI002251BC35|nr:hypothetical protein [Paraliomyxa miuraensis]MCX4248099.1 hypothetical protein [Paraliomyxa miuraensis]
MRCFVVLSLSTVLLTVGCGQDAPKTEPKAKAKDDAKVAAPAAAAPESKAETKVEASAPEADAQPEGESYGGALCSTIIPCFQTFKFTGTFSADVTADIEPDGSVSAVSFTGQAPKPVQTCITAAIERTKVEPYNGKPGRVRCQKNGQLMSGGGQMVMSDHGYELRDPGSAPVEAPVDAPADAPAEEAKAG